MKKILLSLILAISVSTFSCDITPQQHSQKLINKALESIDQQASIRSINIYMTEVHVEIFTTEKKCLKLKFNINEPRTLQQLCGDQFALLTKYNVTTCE
jgi:hypothetical protein